MEPIENLRLTDLKKNESALIIGFSAEEGDLTTRLREIGFAEGDNVTPLHFGLFGRNPMSVRLNGAQIAIRKQDAKAVLVRRDEIGAAE
ncbi:FeoA family protein [Litorimonas sp. WD9-15]|uniref:FeoA family protein n=1 Tax=Litorimonas sp. WD9-15 TaxID=3418716 RepID=UPI003D05FCAE